MSLSNLLPESKIAELRGMDDQELINEFAPVLYFHEEASWLPTNYEQMLETAVLRKDHSRQEVIHNSRPFSQLTLTAKENCLRGLPDSHK